VLVEVGIPDTLLKKPGRLTAKEKDVMQQHPVIGERLCGKLRSLPEGRRSSELVNRFIALQRRAAISQVLSLPVESKPAPVRRQAWVT